MPKTAEYDFDMIRRADHFLVSVFLGVGKYHTEKFDDLAAAREGSKRVAAKINNGRRGMIYAVVPEGRSTFVPNSYQPEALIEGEKTMAKVAKTTGKKTVTRAKAEKPAAAPKAAKPLGKRAAIQAAAERGEMPAAPDFSAKTHTRFRPKLTQVVELAEAGDLKGLKAFEINPISSSPKAIAKYRDLCVTALEAQAAIAA